MSFPPAIPSPEIPKKRLYFASMPFMNYVFTKGKIAVFRHHKFATDIPEEIEQLDNEVRLGHPYISVKKDQMYVTAEDEDPIKAFKAKIIAEYEAEKAKHIDPANDMGTYRQEAIRPASTTDIASVAAGGDATQAAAKLVALTKTMAAQAAPAGKE